MFQEAHDDFGAALRHIERALATGELQRPTIREAFAFGGVGNGLQGLKRYPEAESAYRRCIQVYSDPSTPLSTISVAPTNLASCLWLQGRLTEAETLLHTIIIDRNDVSSYR
jgi:Flp pilus assembly protein TadD